MLSHCANAQCSKLFLRLGEGKLFLVETGHANTGDSAFRASMRRKPHHHLERYWLCAECAAVWTLVHDKRQGIRIAPLPRTPLNTSGGIAAKFGAA